jgi:hypothetical protein
MSIFPLAVYTAVKTALKNSAYLSYVDTVEIRKFRHGNLPKLSHHGIVISPSFSQAVTYPANQKYIINSMHLMLLVLMNYGEEAAILADEPTATPPNVGILPMYEDVFLTLFENNLGGVISLIPGMGELDEPSFFDVVVDEAQEGFIMEARIEYRPKGERFVGPPWS